MRKNKIERGIENSIGEEASLSLYALETRHRKVIF